MNKFLLADNPMRPDDPGLYIIHLLEPVSIIQVDEEHLTFKPGKFYKHYTHEDEDYTLSIHHYFTTELDSEKHSVMVEHVMDRAWRWFVSYMKWEDKQHD